MTLSTRNTLKDTIKLKLLVINPSSFVVWLMTNNQ